jgi:DNA (cytosine-5)-methyltransferase 1
MSQRQKKLIKVAELFAGVGGFREAIEKLNKVQVDVAFNVVWSNQWEPSESAKKGEEQFANRVYIAKFTQEGHFADDIHKVSAIQGPIPKKVVPDIDLLVGGFPCQDYSVAKPKNVSKGLRGPKGVLWWSIERLLEERAPKYVLLENVDRLINSPANNRGRDFAVILKGFQELGYAVEWRVVNAADYGFPQKRRRIFILAYKLNTAQGRALSLTSGPQAEAIVSTGVMAKALPCTSAELLREPTFDLNAYGSDDILASTYRRKTSPFMSAGYMLEGKVYSMKVDPVPAQNPKTLRDVLVDARGEFLPATPKKFLIPGQAAQLWAYAKGRKNEPRRKQAALVDFLKKRTKGAAKISSLEVAKLAKSLPERLSLDFSFEFEFEGGKKAIQIAREELNFKVSLLLGKDANALRPNHVERREVRVVLADKTKRKELEAYATAILADRAISLFAVKDKSKQGHLRRHMSRHAARAVESLLVVDRADRVVLGDVKLELTRDEVASASFAYGYKEGGMAFPDSLDAPGRTIITSEGGASVSRFKHVICDDCAKAGKKLPHDCGKEGQLRRLFPRELEAMNGFSEAHSRACEQLKISDGRRAFFMGNALVVGVVEKILKELVS